jgi:hypothetical protein
MTFADIVEKYVIGSIESVIEPWKEPHRFFHTLEHLNYVLKGLTLQKDDVESELEWEALVLAAFFHDSFYQPNPIDEVLRTTNNDIERQVQGVLEENPDIMYAKVDESNPEFGKLFNVVGITVTPAILLIVHGKGVWISGTNTRLMVERI